FFFFFFQAEDGIRDGHVTGVQTCALPIYDRIRRLFEQLIKETADAIVASGMRDAGYRYVVIDDCWEVARDAAGTLVADSTRFPQIGRASCRERGEDARVAV